MQLIEVTPDFFLSFLFSFFDEKTINILGIIEIIQPICYIILCQHLSKSTDNKNVCLNIYHENRSKEF